MTRLHALRELAHAPAPDAFSGHWSAILWQPDITGVQAFVIGVLVTGNDRPGYRVMDEPGRLACFYGSPQQAQDIAWLLSLLRESLANAPPEGEIRLPALNLSLTPPRFVSGASAQAIANDLFTSLVPAAHPDDKQRKARQNLDTASLRTLVHRELKRIAQLSYEHIVREKNEVIHDRGDHRFDVDIVTRRGVGSIISADYEWQPSIERNLLRAAQDVGAYSSCRDKTHRGIFIYAPERDDLPAKKRKELTNYLLGECWKLETSGFNVANNLQPELVAKDVLAWAEPLIS